MALKKGSAAAKEMNKKVGAGGGFAKVAYLSLKDGDSVVVRFLDDDSATADNAWISVYEHTFIDTRDPKAQHEGHPKLPSKTIENWPRKMNATCRKDEAFEGQFSDCYICDNMRTDKGKPKRPQVRIYARVCIREEVIGTQQMADNEEIPAYKVGKPVGYIDKIKEVDEVDAEGKPTGNKRETLDIQIACFGWKNFYSAMSSAAQTYGTAVDRDYRITREGEGLETEYRPMPMDQMTWNGPNDDEKDQPYTLEDDRLRDYYLGEVDFDMEEIISRRAEDDYYARFFDVRKPIPVREGEGESDSSSSNSNGSSEPEREEKRSPEQDKAFKSMGARLRANAGKPAEAKS